MTLNVNDRVALQLGRLNIAVLEGTSNLDEQGAVLERAWTALAEAAEAGAPPDLEKLKAADARFSAWLAQRQKGALPPQTA